MEPTEEGLPWLIDLFIVFCLLLLLAIIAFIVWPVLRFMDIGEPEEKRVANDFVGTLFDPGSIVPTSKSSYE